ncbi:hypothetical protein VCHA50P415_10300 [Vibrio chagasii]|nr:hypothetical protein VCHA34P131_10201 [Vibrio chagasii]CAH6835689.1 hypothetical protein VCHA36O163_10197 [Vibrio chagasii]CAH6838114.1 hypothetical protein VCHA28O22_10281 [Vibrio chagasii]CAH6838648.1 hypothetical protein VCHA34P112_10082 [Vibrio chagasii]CAH6843889.1 hypothetical protein VCHA35O135_10198 [Vibrio chagasii]
MFAIFPKSFFYYLTSIDLSYRRYSINWGMFDNYLDVQSIEIRLNALSVYC